MVDRWADSYGVLTAADAAMAAAIAHDGPCPLTPGKVPRGAFGALARSICYQQLAGAAAAAIHGRFAALFDGKPTAAAVAATPDDVLRATGLSAAKTASIKDLAAKTMDRTVKLDRWSRRTDAEIIEMLSQVRGIGPWTAQMFLIFTLNRPDVWPTGDYAVRTGYARMHDLAELPTPRELEALGEPYRPWRSVAAWYCWRALDRPAAIPAP
jgi:3-methyladenine DNA glycosylase/8-oxoguanine DNA glycosylase